MNTPVVVFAYNRPGHLARTLDALASNEGARNVDVHVYVDGPRRAEDLSKVESCLQVARKMRTRFGAFAVNQSQVNFGLSRSITSTVTLMARQYGRVIVLEDDVVPSPSFLTFMMEGLSAYSSTASVYSVQAYSFPTEVLLPETYFLPGADCWGWGTWDRAWRAYNDNGARLLRQVVESGLVNQLDFWGAGGSTSLLRGQIRGRNDSWAIRWHVSVFLLGGVSIYPGKSLVTNAGFDGSGVHAQETTMFNTPVYRYPIPISWELPRTCPRVLAAYQDFLARANERTFLRRTLSVLRNNWPLGLFP